MAEFLGDIAFMLEVLIFGLALIVFHYGKKEGAKLLTLSGGFMGVAALLGMVCTGYFYLKYYFDDAFDRAYPTHQMMMKGGMMHGGMMKGGMGMKGSMGSGMPMMGKMKNCMHGMHGKMMDAEAMAKMKSCMMAGSGVSAEEHKEHHPEK